MRDCIVIINDPVLRELLGADQFDTFADLLKAAETRLFNQPFTFRDTTYNVSALSDENLKTVYTVRADDGQAADFSGLETAIGFIFGHVGSINDFYLKSIDTIEEGVSELETLISNPEGSTSDIESLIDAIRKLIVDITAISASKAAELKSKFDEVVSRYISGQGIESDNPQIDTLVATEDIRYAYPVTNIYNDDPATQGFEYTKSLLDIARAKLAFAIEKYEEINQTKVYLSLRKDSQDNPQTGVFPDSKLGVIGELYVKVNGKFERLYVKEGSVDVDINSKIELTTEISEAASLGVNNSKLFTVVIPKFNNPGWNIKNINANVIEDLTTLRESVMQGASPKFYPFDFAYHTHPKYYHTKESSKKKRSQPFSKFIRGRSYNDVELKVITSNNLEEYAKYNLEVGNVVAIIDNVPIKVFNSLRNTTLFEEIKGLLEHTYSNDSDLKEVAEYLNKLFYYQGINRTSILKFEIRGNKIVMLSKVTTSRVTNNLRVTKNTNKIYEEVPFDQLENQLTAAKFNISKNLIEKNSTITQYYIKDNEVEIKKTNSKDLYLDNLNVSAEQVKVGRAYKMLAQVHAVFDMQAGEDLIFNPAQTKLKEADATLPIVPVSVQDYLQNSNLSKANDEILRILLEVAKGATGNLANRIATAKIIVDPSKNTMYNLNDNLIIIGKDVDITKSDELDSAIIHELIHLVVTPWLLDNKNSAIAKRLQEIGDTLVEEDITLDDEYLIHEILARLADPNYRAAIKNHQSLLDEVIDLLRQIFEKIFNKKQNQIDSNTYNRLVGEMLAIVKAEANNNAAPPSISKSKLRFQLSGFKKNKKVDTVRQLITQFEKDRTADLIKFENTIKSLDSIAAFTIYRNENVFRFLKGQLTFETLFNNITDYLLDLQEISIAELKQFENEPELLKIVNNRLNFVNEILENKLKYEYYLKKYSTFLKSTGKIKIGDTAEKEKETAKPADSYTTNDLAQDETKDVKVEKADEIGEEPEQDEQNKLESELTQLGNDRTFDRSGVEASSLKSAEREVLAFIRMNTYLFKEDPFGDKLSVDDDPDALLNLLIPIQNSEFAYESVLDENGIPKGPDLYVLWNTLQRIVADANSFDEMLERMTYENGEMYGHPEIGFLGDRIRRMINTATPENIRDVVRFTTRIWRALNRYSTPMMTVLKSKQESEENPTELPSVKLSVQIHGSDIRTPAINYITNRMLDTYDKAEDSGLIVNGSIKAKKAAELLKSPDSKIRAQAISRLGLRVPVVVERLTSFKSFIDELTIMFEQSTQSDIPLNYIEHFVYKDTQNRVKNFTRAWNVFVNNWNNERPFFRSQMRLNSENELQSDYSIGAAIFKDISYMRSSKTRKELLKNIPRLNTHYGKASKVISGNFYYNIKIFNYNGYQYKQGSKTIGRKSIKLDSPQYLAQSLTSFFKEGVMENIRAQVATTSLGLKVQWGDAREDMYPFSLELVGEMFDNINSRNRKGPKIPQPILELMLRYLRADLLTHNKPVLTSSIFSSIEDSEATIQVISDYMTGGSYESNPDIYTDAIQELESQVVNFIRAEGRYAAKLFEENFVESIISEDPYFAKLAANKSSYYKDSPYHFLYNAFGFYSYIMKVEEVILFHGDIEQIGKFYKRSNSQQSTGTMLDTSENTLALAREELEHESFGSLIGKPLTINETYESASLPDDIRNIAEVTTSRADIRASLQLYNKSKGFKMSIEEENAFMDLYDVYQKSNISDGAAYIHPDAYKVFMVMAGLDTKDFDHIHRANYLMMKKEMYNDLTVNEQEELDVLTEHIFSGKIQLPTLKFSYRGPGTQGGKYLEMFDKFALAPLFPNMFPKDHPGRKMFTFMSTNNLAYVKFESGTKFKNVNKVTGSISEFVKLLEDPNYELSVDNKHQLRTEYLKEQIKTPSKPKMDNTLGVQFRELIISSITDKSLVDVWTDLLTNYIGSKQLQVLKSFGFELNEENKLKINSEALKRNLGRLLVEGVKSRELPASVLEFVENYSKIKDPSEAHTFFEASMSSGILENIISSMINKMVSVKVPGAMFIQLPPTIFGDNLKFYESEQGAFPGGFRVLRAQTKITMPRHMFGMLNIPEIKSKENLVTKKQKFDELNRLMKDSKFREKYAKQLTIITYRIPTQEYNSMEVFEIVEFLPPWFGPHIVLPPGITTKSGTDFDYDKMSSLLPMLDENGNIKDDSLVNTMITSIAAQLLRQENFFRLLKPTSPDDVMNEVKFILNTLGIKYGDPVAGNIFNMSTWFNKWKAVKMKDMLGIAATWNRLYSTLLNNGFEINDMYTTDHMLNSKLKIPYVAPYVKSFSFFDAQRGKGVDNETIGSNLNNQYAASKNFYKWDLLCQFINVTVDASSDDTFGYTNIDKNMFAVAMYMMFIKNVPLDITLQFLHHPVIQEFESLKKEYLIKRAGSSRNEASTFAYNRIARTNYGKYAFLLQGEERKINSIELSNIKFGDTPQQHQQKFKSTARYDPYSDSSMLAHYLFLLEEVNHMFKVQAAIDIDKNYDSRMSLAESRKIKLAEAQKSGFSKKEFIDGILKKSTRSPFYIAPFTSEIYSILYPIQYSKINQAIFGSAIAKKDQTLKMDNESYYRVLTFDFMLSLLHNFGVTHMNESLLERGKKYIDEPIKFLQKVKAIQELIPDTKLRILSNTFILSGFQTKNTYRYTAKFFTGFDNSVEDKNALHEELMIMLNHPNEQVKEFAYDIIYMGMVQSGWRKSQYYFNDILPESVTTPIVYNAMKAFSSLPETEQRDYVRKFRDRAFAHLSSMDTRLAVLFRSYQSNIDMSMVDPNFKFAPLAAELNIDVKPSDPVEYAEYEDVTPESIAAALPSAESVVPGSLPAGVSASEIYPKLRNLSSDEGNVVIDEVAGKEPAVGNKINLPIPQDSINAAISKISFNTRTKDWETTIYTGNGWDYIKNSSSKEELIEAIKQYANKKNQYYLDTPKRLEKKIRESKINEKRIDTTGYGDKKTVGYFIILPIEFNSDYITGETKEELNKNIEKFIEKNVKQFFRPIVAYRTKGNNFLEALQEDNAIGNPWGERRDSGKLYAQYESPSVKEAVIEFIAWMTGEKHTDKLQDYRQEIINRIKSGELKNKTILYYNATPGGKDQPSHASALDYLINEYDWVGETAKTTQEQSINPLIQAGVKPTDMSGNAAKDIQMASESTQFIGFQSGNAAVSSTNKYRLAWGNKANTGNYTSSDIIMISGSGTFRGVTEEQIRKTLTEKYKPLLEKAIKAGASFRVGNRYAKGNLSDKLIADYLTSKGYVEEKLDGYSRWSKSLKSSSVEEALPAAEIVTAPKTPAANMDEASPQLFDPNNKVIQSGSLVLYNGQKYLVYKINDKDSTRMDLVSPKEQILKSVPEKDLIVQGKYKVVLHTNRVNYIVTDKENIYSTKNGKLSYTATDNATATQRNMILRKAYEGVIVPANPKAGIDQPAVGRHPILDARTNSSTFKYTPLQAKALTEIGQLLQQSGNKYYVLAGYAGTGKTTLVENIYNYAKSLNREILIMAPTNKAASNITQKLNAVNITESARTIHGSIYGQPRLNEETGQLKFSVKLKNISNSLIIIDESSMLDTKTLTDMLRIVKSGYNNMIVFMGDSFQLEIGNESSNILTYYKDYENFNKKFGIKVDGYTELTEVMRQQLESDILKTATLTRILNRPIAFDNIDPKEIDFKTTANRSVMLNAFIGNLRRNEDAVYIVGTNDSKVEINHRVREGLHETDANVLVKNEILMSVNNSIFNNNGDIFKVKSIDTPLQEFTIQLQKKNSDGKTEYKNYKVYVGLITGNDNVPRPIVLIPELNLPSVDGSIITSSNRDIKKLLTDLKTYTGDDAPVGKTFVVATYGYAITAHKAQGSQWETVYVDQNSKSKSALEWYYTAITRATKYVRLLQNLEIHYMYTANMINAEFVRIEEEERSKIEQCNPNQTML